MIELADSAQPDGTMVQVGFKSTAPTSDTDQGRGNPPRAMSPSVRLDADVRHQLTWFAATHLLSGVYMRASRLKIPPRLPNFIPNAVVRRQIVTVPLAHFPIPSA
jgi:hypothetical protein